MTEYKSIKEEVLRKIEEKLTEIQECFGIETIGIFGSVARGEDTADSDVDVLYKFENGKSTLYNLIDLTEYLENLFSRKIDAVSVDFIDPYIELFVKKDAVLYGIASV